LNKSGFSLSANLLISFHRMFCEYRLISFLSQIFSPCSKRSIGATIATRGEYCFKSIENMGGSYCGNTRVDHKEECDLGRNNTGDKCCTPDCHFRPGAVCSPVNHECCTESKSFYCSLICNSMYIRFYGVFPNHFKIINISLVGYFRKCSIDPLLMLKYQINSGVTPLKPLP